MIQRFAGSAEEPKKPEAGGDDDEGEAPKGPPTAAMKAGVNRFVWDMRHPGFTTFPDMILWTSRGRGLLALPGQYQARLIVDGKPLTQNFTITADPRAKASPADLAARFALASAVSAKVSQANTAVLHIRGLKEQTAAAAKARPALAAQLGAFDAKLSAIEAEIYQVKNQSRQDPLNYPIKLNDKLAGLIGVIESADAPPTDQTRAVFAELSAALDVQLQALDSLIASDKPALDAALKAAGQKPLERRAPTPPPPPKKA
jgi:hypothetical protein